MEYVLDGMTGGVVFGPYATEADARAALATLHKDMSASVHELRPPDALPAQIAEYVAANAPRDPNEPPKSPWLS